MFHNTRVFVTGGAGVIGTALVKKLLDQGAVIFVGDLKERPEDLPAEVKYRQGDLNYLTKEELSEFAPHYIFHLAATFERSVETYEFWDENNSHNVKLSHHIMTIAKDLPGLEKVVFASSYLIYNPDLYNFAEPAKTPYLLSEDAPIYPRNLCGAAKLLHEIELRFISEMNQLQCKTISARIYRVYGKNSKDIISRWIRALLNNEEIQVFRKEGMFDYIYADEVAEGLVRLASSEAEGIVNLGNGNARRVEDVIAILRKHFPNMRAVEAESSILYEASEADMSKFKSITGWAPTRQLEDTIPELIEYYSAHINNHGSHQSKSILITSSSKKVPLINSVRKAIAKLGQPVQVIAGDSNPNAISRYFADQFWEMPQLSTMSKDQFLQYCKDNHVEYVIPTRDGELEYFSEMKSSLQDNGVSVLVSDREALTVCLDKLAFYQQTTSMSVPVIPATENISELDGELFVVKERFGAGSQDIGLSLNRNQALEHAKTLRHPIYQPYITGVEYSADVYLDNSSTCKGVILRKRDLVVNGESQITYTIRDAAIEQIIASFVEKLGLVGHAVLQYIVDSNGSCHIIECNPRLGGASRLSLEAGLDSIYWFLLESKGIQIDSYPFLRSKEEKKLVRFAEDIIF